MCTVAIFYREQSRASARAWRFKRGRDVPNVVKIDCQRCTDGIVLRRASRECKEGCLISVGRRDSSLKTRQRASFPSFLLVQHTQTHSYFRNAASPTQLNALDATGSVSQFSALFVYNELLLQRSEYQLGSITGRRRRTAAAEAAGGFDKRPEYDIPNQPAQL